VRKVLFIETFIGFLTSHPGFLVVFFSHNRKMSYHRNYNRDCFAEYAIGAKL